MLTQDYIEAKQDLDLALTAEPANRCACPHCCSCLFQLLCLLGVLLFVGGVCLSLTLQTLSRKPRFGHDAAFASCANCVTGIKHIPVQVSVHGCLLSAGLVLCF